jgi:hypothetical protein
MEWYYKKHPQGYQVRKVTGYDHEIVDVARQPATATLRLLTNDGIMHVLLQQTADGWKLDWESFANVYSVLWAEFLKGGDARIKELPMPVEIELCPASTLLPSWFAATGFARADASRAVRLFISQPTNVGVACWSEEDAAGREILEALRQQGGKALKWILQIELVNATTYPPAVRVKSVQQKHWNNPTQPRPDAP